MIVRRETRETEPPSRPSTARNVECGRPSRNARSRRPLSVLIPQVAPEGFLVDHWIPAVVQRHSLFLDSCRRGGASARLGAIRG